MRKTGIVASPNEIQWIKGDLPPVETVPKNSRLLAWFVTDITPEDYENHRCVNYPLPPPEEVNGKLRRISMVMPWENELNPLSWCDSSCFPIGYQERVEWYAWITTT